MRTEVHEIRQFEQNRAVGSPSGKLGLESDGTEELRMPRCVSIADSHELTAEAAYEVSRRRNIKAIPYQ